MVPGRWPVCWPGRSVGVEHFAQSWVDTDGVFSDDCSLQLATVTGSVSASYTAKLNAPA